MADVAAWMHTVDAKSRADALDKLQAHFTGLAAGPLDDSGLSAVVTEMVSWLQTKNYKVVAGALQALKTLAEAHGALFRHHVPELMTAFRDLFSDRYEERRKKRKKEEEKRRKKRKKEERRGRKKKELRMPFSILIFLHFPSFSFIFLHLRA